MSTYTVNLSLYKDLIFNAGFGRFQEYFSTLGQFPHEQRREMTEKTFKVSALDNKNESPKIISRLIELVSDTKTLLDSLEFCYQTKKLNEDISNNYFDSEIRSRSRVTIENCEKNLEIIGQKIKIEDLENLSEKTREYLTTKLPHLQITEFIDPEQEILEKIEPLSVYSDIATITNQLLDYLDYHFSKHNQGKINNQELYITENSLENQHIWIIKILAYINEQDQEYSFKIIKKQNDLIVLTSEKNYFKSIGVVNTVNLPKLIIEHIYPPK